MVDTEPSSLSTGSPNFPHLPLFDPTILVYCCPAEPGPRCGGLNEMFAAPAATVPIHVRRFSPLDATSLNPADQPDSGSHELRGGRSTLAAEQGALGDIAADMQSIGSRL
jgi:hypothetical protein